MSNKSGKVRSIASAAVSLVIFAFVAVLCFILWLPTLAFLLVYILISHLVMGGRRSKKEKGERMTLGSKLYIPLKVPFLLLGMNGLLAVGGMGSERLRVISENAGRAVDWLRRLIRKR